MIINFTIIFAIIFVTLLILLFFVSTIQIVDSNLGRLATCILYGLLFIGFNGFLVTQFIVSDEVVTEEIVVGSNHSFYNIHDNQLTYYVNKDGNTVSQKLDTGNINEVLSEKNEPPTIEYKTYYTILGQKSNFVDDVTFYLPNVEVSE